MAEAEKKEKAATKERRPTAKKRDLQGEKRRDRNKSFKASVRTAIRNFEDAIEKKDSKLVKETLSDVYSAMDKGVKRGLYKPNKANRTKARMTIRALAVA